MWGRMWSSGRGSGSSSGGGCDPEHERRVRSDSARKRGARKWTNKGLEPPPSFLVRETEEYDRRHGRTPSSGSGSSSAARSTHAASSSSSGARLLPVKRERSKEPEEIERRAVVEPEDFVSDFDAVADAIAERSLREEAERRHHDNELDDLILKQTATANLAAKEKDDEWRRIREEQRSKFIDLVSSDED